MTKNEREYLRCLEADAKRLMAENVNLREAIALTASATGTAAVLADCRERLSLALKCVEIGAYPGPAWREGAAQLVELIDRVKP